MILRSMFQFLFLSAFHFANAAKLHAVCKCNVSASLATNDNWINNNNNNVVQEYENNNEI